MAVWMFSWDFGSWDHDFFTTLSWVSESEVQRKMHTWTSQEVSKWLVNGLKPTYKWGILGL